MKADDLRQCSKCPNLYKVADEAEYWEWKRLCLNCQDDVVGRYKRQEAKWGCESWYHQAVTAEQLSGPCGPVSIEPKSVDHTASWIATFNPLPFSWVYDRFVKRPSYWAGTCAYCLQTHTGDCG